MDEFHLSVQARKDLKDAALIKKAIEEGRTAQQVVGYSDETMALFYRAAYQMFVDKRHADAADAFLFLVSLNPANYDFWLGLGMSAQLARHFEEAVDAYEMAAIRDLENPIPYLYLGKCLFALHERDNALQAFEIAIEYAAEREEYAEVKEAATAAQQLLLREQNLD